MKNRHRFLDWFASLHLTIVATTSLFIGLGFSSMEAEGKIDWGHEMLLVSIVPIVAWAVVRRSS